MNVIGKLRAHRLRPLIHNQKQFYDRDWSPAEIRAWQLDQFNEQWQIIQQNVPYFARLARERSLPERFDSWMQFREELPVVNRDTVQEHGDALANTTSSPDFRRVTGGSTGEPVQIPAWSSEQKYEQRDYWYARDWYGITPADRLFLLWGHSHAFGEGIAGWWKKRKRQLKDWLLGYHRFSAYDMSQEALKAAGEALVEMEPDYVLGYSTALDKWARATQNRRRDYHALNLKAVIATAESYPRADSPGVIEETFGAPVVMEYGTVETGPIAYQAPQEDFQIFWRDYKIEGEKTDLADGAYEIFVTSLYPRCFPLIRYRIGDLVRENPSSPRFDQTLSSILGRCNDYIELEGGRRIHSEAITHAVKDIPAVRAYQVHQRVDGSITMYYVGENQEGLEERAREMITQRFAEVDPELQKIELERVSALEQTPAGKQKRVVREGAERE
mgnify:CR=1 FL=1